LIAKNGKNKISPPHFNFLSFFSCSALRGIHETLVFLDSAAERHDSEGKKGK
jgi:hypothetical protein